MSCGLFVVILPVIPLLFSFDCLLLLSTSMYGVSGLLNADGRIHYHQSDLAQPYFAISVLCGCGQRNLLLFQGSKIDAHRFPVYSGGFCGKMERIKHEGRAEDGPTVNAGQRSRHDGPGG